MKVECSVSACCWLPAVAGHLAIISTRLVLVASIVFIPLFARVMKCFQKVARTPSARSVTVYRVSSRECFRPSVEFRGGWIAARDMARRRVGSSDSTTIHLANRVCARTHRRYRERSDNRPREHATIVGLLFFANIDIFFISH